MAQVAYIPGFAGGINQSLSAKDIEDTQLQDAVNLELNQRRSVRVRRGVSYVRTSGGSHGPFSALTSSKVTSIYHFRPSGGGNGTVLYTGDVEVYRRAPSDPDTTTAFTDITGSVSIASAPAYWEWATFDDVAIGVNGSTQGASNDNPVVLKSTTGNLVDTEGSADATEDWTALGAVPFSAPKFIEVWNRRVWIVEGNTVYGCALGDRQDWASTGGSGTVAFPVGEDEGDNITGIFAFIDRLIVFKENRIYQIVAGSPNVDANQYEIRQISDRVGCLHAATVQRVFNDLVFLSHYGVMSLQSTLNYGDFLQSQLSTAIPSLSQINKNGTAPRSILHPEKNQYWLSVPTSGASGADNDTTWILDFQQQGQGVPLPWMKYDGGAVGQAYGLVVQDGTPRVYIGGLEDAYMLTDDRWDDNVHADELETSPPKFRTKAFDWGEPLRRKEHYEVGASVHALTDPLSFDLQWRFDTDPNRQKNVTGSFSDLQSGSHLGPPNDDNVLWDDPPTVGSFVLATDAPDDTDVVWKIRGGAGRRGQTIEFTFQSTDQTQAFEVRRMMVKFDLLEPSMYGVRDFTT
jgi:hypothetical protein